MCRIIYSVALGIILGNSNLKLTSTSHEKIFRSNLSCYTQQIWQKSQNIQNLHIKKVTYICKQVTDVEFWSKIMNKLCFLQQDTHTFAKQDDNKCTSADLQQGSN